MKKSQIIAIVFIIFLSACSSATSTKKTSDVDVRVGFKGLTVDFIKNAPPVKVFELSSFPVMLDVKNIGAYDLKENNKAIISLGYEKDYTKSIQLNSESRVQPFDTSQNIAAFELEGKSSINSRGGEEIVSFNLGAGNIDPQSEAHPSTVIATLCYPYQTVLETNACIDKDVANIQPIKKVCTVQDMNFNNGQGAPVAVTKIEAQMLPVISQQYGQTVKPQFLVYIENKGSGTVTKSDSIINYCTKSNFDYGSLNIVSVKATLSSKELDCKKSGKNEVKLKDKKEIIRCTLQEPIQSDQDNYISPLRIELNYGYTQSITANYYIQKTSRYP